MADFTVPTVSQTKMERMIINATRGLPQDPPETEYERPRAGGDHRRRGGHSGDPRSHRGHPTGHPLMAKKKTLPDLIDRTREVERETNPDVGLILDGNRVARGTGHQGEL